MGVTVLSGKQNFNELINSGKTVVIDFWATWCGPCRFISPIFEEVSNSGIPGIDFYKVDVDVEDEISQEVGIRAMPTFIVFKDGNKIDELIGANPSGLKSMIERHAS
ncbi:hypothetical protein MauCBS54593_001877 [Microsporum audouinii]